MASAPAQMADSASDPRRCRPCTVNELYRVYFVGDIFDLLQYVLGRTACESEPTNAAAEAAILSAATQPILNGLLVGRVAYAQEEREITVDLIYQFFLSSFPVGAPMFSVVEATNMELTFASISGRR